jgi:hypothetical protein
MKFSQQLLHDIHSIRDQRQLSYRQLAKESFVPRNVIWSLLRGSVNRVSLQNLDRLWCYRKKWEKYLETTYQ